MQYLPKRNEMYLSALRKFVARSINLHGYGGKRLKMLRCVRRAELKLREEYLCCVDFKNLTDSVMYAAVIAFLKLGRILIYNIKSNAEIMIDPKMYTAFLSELCSSCGGKAARIDITVENEEIRIIGAGVDNINKLLFYIEKMGGIYYFSNDLKKTAIRIPVKTAITPPERVYSVWEFINDSFSDINVFLGDE